MGAYLATGSKPVLRALPQELRDHKRSLGVLPDPCVRSQRLDRIL